MSTGQHESISPRPMGVAWVVSHHLLEQQVRDWGKAHRGARMAVADVLDGIGGKHADGVDGWSRDRSTPRETEPEMSVSVTLVPGDPFRTALRAVDCQPGQCEPIGGESVGDIGSAANWNPPSGCKKSTGECQRRALDSASVTALSYGTARATDARSAEMASPGIRVA